MKRVKTMPTLDDPRKAIINWTVSHDSIPACMVSLVRDT